MAEEKGPLRYCITQDICGLCRFPLFENDLVWAFVGDDGVPLTFQFKKRTYCKNGINIHTCLSYNCQFGDPSVFCAHDSCYEFRLSPPSPKIFASTCYDYTPSAADTRHRFRYINEILAQRLLGMASWPQKLPSELWLNIATYLVPECAISMAQELTYRHYECRDTTVSFEKPIYASYIKIDDRYYIKRLQNIAEVDGGVSTYHILPAKTQRSKKLDMVIAEDYLGIRQVIFIPAERCEKWCCEHTAPTGTWWKHVSWNCFSSTLVLISDGLKLRKIKGPSDACFPASSNVSWQVPVASTPKVIDLLNLEELHNHKPSIRMRVLNCNTPNITGYSIITDGINIRSIISHKRGENINAGMCEHVDAKSFCMYMPMNQGEYLTHICRRTALMFSPQPDFVGMTLSTNKFRTVAFGFYAGEEIFDTQLVVELPPTSCRVYFNERDRFVNMSVVKVIGIDQSTLDLKKLGPTELPHITKPITTCPYEISSEPWLYSSCSMVKIAEICACIGKTAQCKPIMGMLIKYEDGHTECVGQVRLDWLGDPINMNAIESFYICGELKRSQNAFVSAISTKEPNNVERKYWLEIAPVGILEWWFSPSHSVLYHCGERLN